MDPNKYPTHTENTLREICADAMSDISLNAFTVEKCEKKKDFLSLYILDAIENADSPEEVKNACQYAIAELEAAAFAAGELEEKLTEVAHV